MFRSLQQQCFIGNVKIPCMNIYTKKRKATATEHAEHRIFCQQQRNANSNLRIPHYLKLKKALIMEEYGNIDLHI